MDQMKVDAEEKSAQTKFLQKSSFNKKYSFTNQGDKPKRKIIPS